MATLNVPARMSFLKPERSRATDRLASSKSLCDFTAFHCRPRRKYAQKKQSFTVKSIGIFQDSSRGHFDSHNGPVGSVVSLLFLVSIFYALSVFPIGGALLLSFS